MEDLILQTKGCKLDKQSGYIQRYSLKKDVHLIMTLFKTEKQGHLAGSVGTALDLDLRVMGLSPTAGCRD